MESLVKLNTMSFKSEVKKEILVQGKDKKILNLTKKWMERAQELKYSYHFEWMGRPIIQHPQDMIAAQQLIWDIKPDLIIETGIARGGSLIFYASLLELISQSGVNKNAKVLGIDIDIRKDNLKSIKKHPMIKRINLIEGSSTDRKIYVVSIPTGCSFRFFYICHLLFIDILPIDSMANRSSPSYLVLYSWSFKNFNEKTLYKWFNTIVIGLFYIFNNTSICN